MNNRSLLGMLFPTVEANNNNDDDNENDNDDNNNNNNENNNDNDNNNKWDLYSAFLGLKVALH